MQKIRREDSFYPDDGWKQLVASVIIQAMTDEPRHNVDRQWLMSERFANWTEFVGLNAERTAKAICLHWGMKEEVWEVHRDERPHYRRRMHSTNPSNFTLIVDPNFTQWEN